MAREKLPAAQTRIAVLSMRHTIDRQLAWVVADALRFVLGRQASRAPCGLSQASCDLFEDPICICVELQQAGMEAAAHLLPGEAQHERSVRRRHGLRSLAA